MRLNLGEIAQLLALGPEDVLWEGAREGLWGSSVCEAPREPASLWEIAHASASRNGEEGPEFGLFGPGVPDVGRPSAGAWSHAPWAGLSVTGGQVDSRLVAPGNLFFCLPGEKADGHDFARAAIEAGAVGIIASRNPLGEDCLSEWPATPIFLVSDVKRALWRVAMCHRDTSLARVIGITGTAGKTSVKEVLAQVLEVRGRTERNPMNFNNQIGLPISMLNASADASFWVMEAGISEAHDMKELGAILRPDLALILNVGEGHVQGLGDRGVAAYKAMLLDYIQPGGLAVVSADYPDLTAETLARRPAMERKGIEYVSFSAAGWEAQFSARYEGENAVGKGTFEIRQDGTAFKIEAPFMGHFGAENVAAVAAVALSLGLNASEAAHGFAMARLPDQRFNILQYPGCVLIDDSYNANPLSATRMIQATRRMAEGRGLKLILVMGEMLELGDRAAGAHRELGLTMGLAEPEAVFWKGGHAADVEKGLAEAGYAKRLYPVAGGQEFALLLEETDLTNTLVLFKGSRGNKLERLVDIMKARFEPEGEGDAV